MLTCCEHTFSFYMFSMAKDICMLLQHDTSLKIYCVHHLSLHTCGVLLPANVLAAYMMGADSLALSSSHAWLLASCLTADHLQGANTVNTRTAPRLRCCCCLQQSTGIGDLFSVCFASRYATCHTPCAAACMMCFLQFKLLALVVQ